MKKSKIEKLSSDITDVAIGRYTLEFQKHYEELSKEYTPDIATAKAINKALPVLVRAISEKLIDELS